MTSSSRIVRAMDGALNNTSVILLMQVGKKKFLFPGDAQWENWEYALRAGQERSQERRPLQGRAPWQPERDAEVAVEAVREARQPHQAGAADDAGVNAIEQQARTSRDAYRGAAGVADYAAAGEQQLPEHAGTGKYRRTRADARIRSLARG